ncbi:hypothetical protein FEM08_33670 [Flavobacterium gilvum]|nr:hypothetical protein FEM08_33670 [Flavobacterium gilvum]
MREIEKRKVETAIYRVSGKTKEEHVPRHIELTAVSLLATRQIK